MSQSLPSLASNMLFRSRHNPDAPCYRIVFTGRGSVHTFYVPIQGEHWPEHELTDSICRRLSPSYEGSDALQFVAADPHTRRAHVEPGFAAKKRKAWIEPLLADAQMFFVLMTPERRGAVINARAQQCCTSRQTLSKWLQRYLARGMDISALEDDRCNCGGKGKERNAKASAGRPRLHKAGRCTPVNDENRSIMATASALLMSKVCKSYQAALDIVNDKFCADWPEASRFTPRQLSYFISKHYPYSVRKRAKHGSREYNLKHRPFVGTSDVYGPGAQFQIDATVGDIYLVSALNRAKVVGRPTIYLVTDTYSRMIVGLYVGFEAPSYYGAALSIENVLTSKVAYCRALDIDIEEAMWPSHHLPAAIQGDGAKDVTCRAWNFLAADLGIGVGTTTAYRPDWKAIVEGRFALLPPLWSPFAPGYVAKDYKQRGGHDYRLDAVMTLREFTRLLIWSVIEYNNRPLAGVHLPVELVRRGVAPSPAELWHFGVETGLANLKLVDLDRLRASMYPRAVASTTHRGIEFAGGCFETPRAVREEWFAQARHSRKTAEIAYDLCNPAKCYVIYSDGSFELATPRDTNRGVEEVISYAEYLAHDAAKKKNLSDAKDRFGPIRREINRKKAAIVEDAKRKSTEAKRDAGIRTPDITEIRERRNDERAYEQAIRAGDTAIFEMKKNDQGDSSHHISTSNFNRVSIDSMQSPFQGGVTDAGKKS